MERGIVDMDYNPFNDQYYNEMWGSNTKEKMCFYYDESNNCRKFWLDSRKDDFNSDPDSDFVLAGVASEKELIIPFEEIQSRFKLQKNMPELKSKTLYRGKDFLTCIGTKTVSALFDVINDYDLYIHYEHVNNFFYTIVEILDSITTPQEMWEYGFDYFQLKTTIFDMLHPHINSVTNIMIRYSYPNISKEDVKDFCMDLCNLLGPKYEMKPDEKFVYGLLQRASKGDELFFIQDNPEFMLQEDYAIFYVSRIMQFPLSRHCFDEELCVQPIIEKQVDLFAKGKSIKNYFFAKSDENTMIQLSDLVAGLFGKMFLFFNQHGSSEFRSIVSTLSYEQLFNLCELQRLRTKSDVRNKGLLHSITSIGMLAKINIFYDHAYIELKRRKEDKK